MNYVTAYLPTKFGDFNICVWPEAKGLEPVALVTPNLDTTKPVLVRVHSECLTGDTFNSQKCDCGIQKEEAMKMISKSGNGILIYLRQEGRGIGLYEKTKAYKLQEDGYDTHEANIILGHKPDLREYSWAKKILDDLNIKQIRLITNNPSKIIEISNLGFDIVETIPLIVKSNKHNKKYLESKVSKFKHFFGKKHTHYFFGISGIESVSDVESIGLYMKDKKIHPLLKIYLGIASDKDTLSNKEKISKIKDILKFAEKQENLIPILHHSFRDSDNPISELKRIKKEMPFIKFIQLNDLMTQHSEMLKKASGYFLVIFPLSDSRIDLLKDDNFVSTIIKRKVFVLLDNSCGKGLQDSFENYQNKIKRCLERGMNDIILAGGFGPNHLQPYFDAKDYFKISFSIDAESQLSTEGKLDIEKVKSYLSQLLKV